MYIKKLSLSGLRAFSQAEFHFKPGMNLLVGVNGVGKTTVLDALRISLSKVIPELTSSKARKDGFIASDIKIGSSSAQITCEFEFNNTKFSLVTFKQRLSSVPRESDNPREQTVDTPDIEQLSPQPLKILFPNSSKSETQPVAVLYSTRRSLITDKEPAKSSLAGGQAAAHGESLSQDREFNLRIFAQWFRVQQELAEENPMSLRHIAVMTEAVGLFLPQFSNLHVVETAGKAHFIIDKSGTPLSLFQLSDGERGVLSMVLDIARRLSQANPNLEHPLRDGKGIILIDELDLHLHPKWQRTIVENLTRVFPKLQFICTTHSPQIIGEVPHEKITIINNETYNPASSYGIDSSRILEEILDTSPRNSKVDAMLKKLYKNLDEEKLEEAKMQLVRIIEILGPNDPDIVRSSTMINFLEGDSNNETDKKE